MCATKQPALNADAPSDVRVSPQRKLKSNFWVAICMNKNDAIKGSNVITECHDEEAKQREEKRSEDVTAHNNLTSHVTTVLHHIPR